jgi:hypothetical protein
MRPKELALPEARGEGRALEGPQAGADADLLEEVGGRLAHGHAVNRVADHLAAVEPVRISGLGQELSRALDVMGHGRRRPEEFLALGDDAGRVPGETEVLRLVDPDPVDGEAGRAAHAHVRPG